MSGSGGVDWRSCRWQLARQMKRECDAQPSNKPSENDDIARSLARALIFYPDGYLAAALRDGVLKAEVLVVYLLEDDTVGSDKRPWPDASGGINYVIGRTEDRTARRDDRGDQLYAAQRHSGAATRIARVTVDEMLDIIRNPILRFVRSHFLRSEAQSQAVRRLAG